MNIKPDTHCFDEDTQSDVWSYSQEIVDSLLNKNNITNNFTRENFLKMIAQEAQVNYKHSDSLQEALDCFDEYLAMHSESIRNAIALLKEQGYYVEKTLRGV